MNKRQKKKQAKKQEMKAYKEFVGNLGDNQGVITGNDSDSLHHYYPMDTIVNVSGKDKTGNYECVSVDDGLLQFVNPSDITLKSQMG
ncbi:MULTISPECIES: hypothetical protein [Bacillus cereus group]|uniref:Uncharacterized protein n=1 Tax=Bacillus thuringiensis TaxID=1428 RepID=A0A9X7ASC6_BACTU|nr:MULTISPECIES: hypothetical protein [Bacillus cereus group]PFT50869.1 hypothetical protein COK72_02350 [Bacillus thuringiensis]PFY22906.1 hypothetical protein COL44_18670 [Bacillus toyonensis]